MRSAYKFLAFAVAGLVALQAAFMVFAVAGLGIWVDEGNSLTKATMEADEPPDFTGAIGFMLHGMNGMMLIPLVALVLLIVSFFAKIPGGPMWAGMVLGFVVLQVALGIFGHESAYVGFLHGINALILFSVATQAGRRVATAVPAGETPLEASAAR
ncbi:MAG: hypothetical protein ABWY19_05375 [Marmoricola sp.]